MRIELKPMPERTDGLVVGTLDGAPLVFQGRKPLVGDRVFEHHEVQQALLDAVDEAAGALFGSEWPRPLSIVTGLNARSCAKDRVWKYGLPGWVLVLLGRAAAHDSPRALGDILLGVARIRDNYLSGTTVPGTSPRDRDAIAGHAWRVLNEALDTVAWVRERRAEHRVSNEKDTNP
jgi:hypothetical protein